jgi:hypothetical protein
MNGFSPSDAALEGFNVIRVHWRVVAGWSLFNLLALLAGCVVLTVLLLGIVRFAGSRETAGAIGAALGSLILGLGGAAAQVVVICGLYRLMLRPQEPGFLHLRIGADELRVLAVFLLLFLGVVVVAVPSAALVMAAGSVSGPLAALLGVAAGLAVYAAALRLGPASVATFAEHKVQLRSAWRMTKGATLRLVGMSLLLFCLLAMIEVVGWLLLIGVSGAIGGFQDLGMSEPDTVAQHPGRYVVSLGLQLLAAPFLLVIAGAPWVAVYRALSGSAAEPA